MNLNLTWDLFIIAFLAVVIAYSFIIGRNQILKVITASYIAILCADALGNLFAKYFASSSAFLRFLRLFSIGNAEQATAFFKVLILISTIVIIAVKGLFDYDASDERPLMFRFTINLLLGILSGGLMLSAILIFVSGSSLVGGSGVGNSLIGQIYQQSHLVRAMIDFSNFWFFVPGLSLILVSVFSKK